MGCHYNGNGLISLFSIINIFAFESKNEKEVLYKKTNYL